MDITTSDIKNSCETSFKRSTTKKKRKTNFMIPISQENEEQIGFSSLPSSVFTKTDNDAANMSLLPIQNDSDIKIDINEHFTMKTDIINDDDNNDKFHPMIEDSHNNNDLFPVAQSLRLYHISGYDKASPVGAVVVAGTPEVAQTIMDEHQNRYNRKIYIKHPYTIDDITEKKVLYEYFSTKEKPMKDSKNAATFMIKDHPTILVKPGIFIRTTTNDKTKVYAKVKKFLCNAGYMSDKGDNANSTKPQFTLHQILPLTAVVFEI